MNFKYREKNAIGWRRVDVYIDGKKYPFWMKQFERAKQEIWEYKGRFVSLVDLILYFTEQLPSIEMINLLKRHYKNNRWEWVEMPTPLNGEQWGEINRHKTRTEAREAIVSYLVFKDNEIL